LHKITKNTVGEGLAPPLTDRRGRRSLQYPTKITTAAMHNPERSLSFFTIVKRIKLFIAVREGQDGTGTAIKSKFLIRLHISKNSAIKDCGRMSRGLVFSAIKGCSLNATALTSYFFLF